MSDRIYIEPLTREEAEAGLVIPGTGYGAKGLRDKLRAALTSEDSDRGEYGRHLQEVCERHRRLPASEQRVQGREPEASEESPERCGGKGWIQPRGTSHWIQRIKCPGCIDCQPERCGGSGEVLRAFLDGGLGERFKLCPGCPDCSSESVEAEAHRHEWGDVKRVPLPMFGSVGVRACPCGALANVDTSQQYLPAPKEGDGLLDGEDRARLELIRDHDGNDLSPNDKALLTRLAEAR